MEFHGLVAVRNNSNNNTGFCDVTLCTLIATFQCNHLTISGQKGEDWWSMIPRNFDGHPPDNSTSNKTVHYRRMTVQYCHKRANQTDVFCEQKYYTSNMRCQIFLFTAPRTLMTPTSTGRIMLVWFFFFGGGASFHKWSSRGKTLVNIKSVWRQLLIKHTVLSLQKCGS